MLKKEQLWKSTQLWRSLSWDRTTSRWFWSFGRLLSLNWIGPTIRKGDVFLFLCSSSSTISTTFQWIHDNSPTLEHLWPCDLRDGEKLLGERDVLCDGALDCNHTFPNKSVTSGRVLKCLLHSVNDTLRRSSCPRGGRFYWVWLGLCALIITHNPVWFGQSEDVTGVFMAAFPNNVVS